MAWRPVATSWIVLAVACGPGARPPVEVDNQATTTGEIHVYGWNGNELIALYCFAGGRLQIEHCAWAMTLELPLEPPLTLRHSEADRELLDGEPVHVHTYAVPPFGEDGERAGAPILVVESDAGVTVWTADLLRGGPNSQPLPVSRPVLAIDRAAVALLPTPESVHAPGYTTPTPVAVLDLDRDDRGELVYIGTDDGGLYVDVGEDDPDAGDAAFEARGYE